MLNIQLVTTLMSCELVRSILSDTHNDVKTLHTVCGSDDVLRDEFPVCSHVSDYL